MRQRTTKELRKFGVTVGGAFVVLGGISRWRGHELVPMVLWAIGAALVVPGLLMPRLLAPVERGWLRFAEVLGTFNTRVILSALFYAVLTPIGIVLRAVRDPLDRGLDDRTASNWKRRSTEPVTRERYEQQF
jgi:hypothetical protein